MRLEKSASFNGDRSSLSELWEILLTVGLAHVRLRATTSFITTVSRRAGLPDGNFLGGWNQQMSWRESEAVDSRAAQTL